MIRQLIRLIFVLIIFFALLTTASIGIGSAIETTITAALISETSRGGIYVQPRQIALFDLNRFLRADHLLPLEHIDFIMFNYSDTSPQQVIVRTSNTPGPNSDPGGLYLYNFLNGRLITVFEERAQQTATTSTNAYYHYPIVSPNERKVAFFHPQDAKPYSFDTETTQLSEIAFHADETSGTPDLVNWVWSPDSSKIAIRGTTTLYITDADQKTSDLIEYPLGSFEVYPIWSEDSRYILLQRNGANSETHNFPVKVIDVSDGSEHPFTKDLQASSAGWYGCGNRWLTYTVVTDKLREGYILDLHDGTTIRVNDTAVLAEEPIEQILPAPDCQHFVVRGDRIGEPGMRLPIELDVRFTYIFNPAAKTAEYLDETSALIQLTDEKELYYQTLTDDRSFWQVYKRSIDPLGEPVLVSQYPPLVAGFFQWSSDMAFATYLETTPSQVVFGAKLRLLDAATGQTFPLTSDQEIARNYIQYSSHGLQNTE